MARKQKCVRLDEVTFDLISKVAEFAYAVTGVRVTETALMERFLVDGMANYVTKYCRLAQKDPEWAASRVAPLNGRSFTESAEELAGITLSHAMLYGLQEKSEDYVDLLNILLNTHKEEADPEEP